MIKKLYPERLEEIPLQGTYLDLKLHKRAKEGDTFIYANYISSLDGRISLLDQRTGEFSVPDAIANARDWRLYQELAGQSDVMLTSGRYFRQLAKGIAQDLLPVGTGPDFADIQKWRKQQQLKAQPDVVILSDSLDIPLEALCMLSDRKITVLTKYGSTLNKLEKLNASGVQVIQAQGAVTGWFIRKTLITLGYRSAYMIAGPKVHHTLVSDSCVDELFLTSHFSLLGSQPFHSILEENMDATKLKLKSLYLDEEEGQMFMRYTYAKRDE